MNVTSQFIVFKVTIEYLSPSPQIILLFPFFDISEATQIRNAALPEYI